MKFEIAGSKINFKKRLSIILAMVLAFSCLQPGLGPIVAYATNIITNGNIVAYHVTGGDDFKVTNGNQYTNNVTAGNPYSKRVSDGNIYYKLVADESAYYVYGVGGGVVNAEIPSTHEGLPVVRIGRAAFADCKKLESVTIPDSITAIDELAFYGCSKLNNVYITDIAAWCNIRFDYYCRFTTQKNKYYKYDHVAVDCRANPLYYARNMYLNGEVLTDLVIPEGVTAIPAYAFMNLKSIVSVTIPASVESIGYKAFYGCKSLQNVNIADVAKWCNIAFDYDVNNRYTGYEIQRRYYSVTVPSYASACRYREYLEKLGYEIESYNFRYSWGDYRVYYYVVNWNHMRSGKYGNETHYSANPLYYADYLYVNGESVDELVIPDGVSRIPNRAFLGVKNISSVKLPDSLCSIDEYAFYNCSLLTYITIPESVTKIGDYAFCGNTNLASVVLGDRVEKIGGYAFCNCKSLATLTIPDSVVTIGDSAFFGSGIATIDLGNGVQTIGRYAFNDCINLTALVLPDSVRDIGDYAFCGNTYLANIVLGEGIKTIGYAAFYNCPSLTFITISDSVTSIGDYAFCGNANLSKVDLGNGVKKIGRAAFYNCQSLFTIDIPGSVESIGDFAFGSCRNLYSIDLTEGLEIIGSYAFFNCPSFTTITIPDGVKYIAYKAFCDCKSLVEIALPDSVTGIGDRAFENCSSLASVDLGEGLTALGIYVFNGCTSLKSLAIPGSVKTIQDRTFSGNTSIENIVLEKGIEKIGYSAFAYCSSLTSITTPDTVTCIGLRAFDGCNKLKDVYVTDIAAWCETHFCNVDGYSGMVGGGDTGNYTSNPLYYAENLYLNGELVTELVIPEGVSTISSIAFYNYDKLTSVELGENFKSCGYGVFSQCDNLKTVYWNAANANDFFEKEYNRFDCGKYEGCSRGSAHCNDSTSCGWYGSFKYGVDNNNAAVFSGSGSNNGGINFVFGDTVERIPAYLTSIGGASIKSVSIGKNVTKIGKDAFINSANLKEVSIKDVAQICNMVYEGSTDLDINYEANPVYYADTLYLNGELLTDLVIPEGITQIIDYAFYGIRNIETVSIPGTVVAMGENSFRGCNNITEMNVSVNNTIYSSVEGILLNKAQTTILKYPAANDRTVYDMPNSVTTIKVDAFANSKNLTAIILSDSLKNIGADVFSDCSNLKTVVFPVGIVSVGYGAFGNSGPVGNFEILYDGTQEQWQKIVIAANNQKLSEGRVHYGVGKADWENHITYSTTVQPTCTQDGSTGLSCDCGYEVTDVIKALGHSYSSEWTIKQEATCTEYGYKHRKCIRCDEGTDTQYIYPEGHVYSTEWTIVPATCTTNGSKYHKCTKCDYGTDYTYVAATGHNYVEHSVNDSHPHTITDKCTFCQYERVKTPIVSGCVECNFAVAESTNGYKLVSYKGSEKFVVIPAKYKNQSVTTISNACFRGNSVISTVRISEGVTSIGALAFMNCPSLKKVAIPESVSSIGSQAFYGFNGAIYCIENSYAHQYAVANNIPFVIETKMPITETASTKIDYDNFTITTVVESADDIIDILGVSDTSEVIATPSYSYGDVELYGTGTVITVFDNGKFIGDFILVVEGDTNGDSVCDALDASQVALVSNESKILLGAYKMAADNNGDDMVDINDYQAIINKVVS